MCCRCTNKTGNIQGSAGIIALRQDRPHPAEGVLWLHMFHHVDWSQNRGPPTARLTQGPQTKMAIPQSQYYQFQLFSPKKDFEAWMAQCRCQLRIFQESSGCCRDVIFHSGTQVCQICLSLNLFHLVFLICLCSPPLSQFSLLFSFLLLLIISAQPTYTVFIFHFQTNRTWFKG